LGLQDRVLSRFSSPRSLKRKTFRKRALLL
jgi:hypothetical protein